MVGNQRNFKSYTSGYKLAKKIEEHLGPTEMYITCQNKGEKKTLVILNKKKWHWSLIFEYQKSSFTKESSL